MLKKTMGTIPLVPIHSSVPGSALHGGKKTQWDEKEVSLDSFQNKATFGWNSVTYAWSMMVYICSKIIQLTVGLVELSQADDKMLCRVTFAQSICTLISNLSGLPDIF